MPKKPPPTYDLGFVTAPAAPKTTLITAAATGRAPDEIALDLLDDNPFQPEERGDPTKVAELAEVIGRQGFHGRLLARPNRDQPGRYQLAYGHQRRDAARLVGVKAVPVAVEDLTDDELMDYIITENIHRQDLDPLQEARTYDLMSRRGLTQEEIAERVGKGRTYVTKRLGLLVAPADVQELVRDKPDSLRAAATLKQIADPTLRGELIAGLREGRLTTNDIAEARRTPLPPAPVAPPPATTPRADTPATPPAPSPTVAALMAPEAAEARAGRLRLAGLVSSLTRYTQDVRRREEISLAEYTHLQELRGLIEDLLTTYAPVEGTDG